MNYNSDVYKALRNMGYTDKDFDRQEKEAENCLIHELKENNYDISSLRKTGSLIALSNLIEFGESDRIREILGRDITDSEITYVMMEVYD